MATAAGELAWDYTFTLLVVGSDNVGKATFMKRLHEAEEDGGYNTGTTFTRGYVNKKLDGKSIKIKIWDPKLLDVDEKVDELGYKEADGIIVMYDVTNMKSFGLVEQKWVKQIRKWSSDNVAVMIMGNKCDCKPSDRAVISKLGQSYATKHGYQFMEISCEENVNVTRAIDRITRIMIGPLPRIKKSVFYKAVNKTKGELKMLNVILHGPPGVGRKSLKRIILGLPPLAVNSKRVTRSNSFDERYDTSALQLRRAETCYNGTPAKPRIRRSESSETLSENSQALNRVHVQLSPYMLRAKRNRRRSFVTIDQANGFREISNEDLVHFLAGTLLDQIRNSQVDTSNTTAMPPGRAPSIIDLTIQQASRGIRFLNQLQSPITLCRRLSAHLLDDINDSNAENIDMTKAKYIRLLRDEIAVFDNNNLSSTLGLFQSNWQNLIDSGGQPQFQDMLPSIFHTPSLQIVLMRLTEDLDEKPKMQYTVETTDDSVVQSSDDLSLTNLQYIERACQIAASCDPTPSKVIIVGTHKDVLEAQFGVQKAKGKIADINKYLKEKVWEHYKDVLVPQSDDIIFDMNTMEKGEERKKLTTKMQEMISRFTSDISFSNKQQKVLLKWLCFHLAIDKELGMVTYRDCLTIGKSLGMGSDSVTKALKYFSDTGLLLYCPNEVPDLILTKMDPLINRLSNLIKASILSPNPILKSKCDDFKQHGTFNKAFYDELCRAEGDTRTSESVQQAALDDETFFKFLLHLKLAFRIGADEYFLPSALSFYNSSQADQSDISSQYQYHENCGFALVHNKVKHILPHGFFLSTAIELQSSSLLTIGHHFQFELRKDHHGDQQYRDRLQFHDKNEYITDVVILTDNSWWIQVTVANKSTRPDPRNLQEIRRAVKKAIKRAIKSNSLRHINPDWIKKVFPCPEKGHEDHYCTLIRDKSEYKCSINSDMTGLASQFMCWSGRPYAIDTLYVSPPKNIPLIPIVPVVPGQTANNKTIPHKGESPITINQPTTTASPSSTTQSTRTLQLPIQDKPQEVSSPKKIDSEKADKSSSKVEKIQSAVLKEPSQSINSSTEGVDTRNKPLPKKPRKRMSVTSLHSNGELLTTSVSPSADTARHKDKRSSSSVESPMNQKTSVLTKEDKPLSPMQLPSRASTISNQASHSATPPVENEQDNKVPLIAPAPTDVSSPKNSKPSVQSPSVTKETPALNSNESISSTHDDNSVLDSDSSQHQQEDPSGVISLQPTEDKQPATDCTSVKADKDLISFSPIVKRFPRKPGPPHCGGSSLITTPIKGLDNLPEPLLPFAKLSPEPLHADDDNNLCTAVPETSEPTQLSNTQPTHNDVFRLLRPISEKWDDIALELDMGYKDRKAIRTDSSIHTDDRRLEAVINKWLEEYPSPPTWETLYEVLKKLKCQQVIQTLVEKYGRNRCNTIDNHQIHHK